MSIFERSVTYSFFRNCTHILTRTQRKKFENVFFVKIANKGTSSKGKSGQKISLAEMKEHEKCKKNEPSLTSRRQMVLKISYFKVKNLSKMDVAIL